MHEIESNIIGCILFDYKKCLPVVQSILTSEDFFEPKLAQIYRAACKLDGSGAAVDALTVYEELNASGIDIKVSELSALSSLGFITAHLPTYCANVKDASKTRKLAVVLQVAREQLTQLTPFDDVVGQLTGAIAELEKDKTTEMINAADVINDVYEEVKAGKQQGVRTGYDKIDTIINGFHKSNLIVLAADTGKGKTALALNFAANILANYKTVLLYTLEMSYSEILKRMLAIMSGANSNQSDSSLLTFTPELVKARLDACGLISGYNFILSDKMQTIHSIRATAKAKANELARDKRHIDMVIVDYMQIIQRAGRADSRQSEVAEDAQGLKALAKELDCPVLALSQVNRDYDKEGRDHKINDLRESAAIGHAADVAMFLNSVKDSDSEYKLNVVKNRHGATFFMRLLFNKNTTKFDEIQE